MTEDWVVEESVQSSAHFYLNSKIQNVHMWGINPTLLLKLPCALWRRPVFMLIFNVTIPLQTSSPNSSNENSPVSPTDEQGQGDGPHRLEKEEPAFPHADLAKLDDMINRYFPDVVLFAKEQRVLWQGPHQCLSADYQNSLSITILTYCSCSFMQNLILFYIPCCNIIPPPGVAVKAADEALKLKPFDKPGCKHFIFDS